MRDSLTASLIPILFWIGWSLSCIRHELKDYLAAKAPDTGEGE